jgi:asparagine synthase (glutamine-hydrolysing)
MPGLSVVYGTDLIAESLSSLKHNPNIMVKKTTLGKKSFVVLSGFEGYPFFQYANEDFAIFLEGMIYNLSAEEITDGLSRIARSYLQKLDYKNEIGTFVSNCCGEFIALIHLIKTGDFLLFNDQWGRLPFFWFTQGNNIILSREIKFILHYISKIYYNKMALLEFLVLGYPLGDRTIFQDIFRFLPGHLIARSGNLFSFEAVVGLNFESSCFKSRSRKYYAEKAKNILYSSAENRLSKLKAFNSKVVDISGGYDTRAVLAVISQLDKNVVPVTVDLVTGDESSVAIQVAKTCGLEALLIKPNRDFSSSTVQGVLYKTDGFIDGWVATSSYQDTEELIRQVKEPIAEFMGFGGEFLRHPLKTQRFFKNMLDVINCLVPSTTLIKSTCRCLGLREKDVYDFWSDFFNSTYRELKIEDKVIHYYFDYYTLYVCEGIDRRRIHLWPVNPMMSSEWLRFSTKEVPRDLINYELFEEILYMINPHIAVSEIPIWNRNSRSKKNFLAIKNCEAIQKLIICPKTIRKLKKRLQRRLWKKIAREDAKRKTMIDEIEKLYQETKTIRYYFDRESVVQFYQTEFGPNNLFLRLLHSVFLYMNKLESTFSE